MNNFFPAVLRTYLSLLYLLWDTHLLFFWFRGRNAYSFPWVTLLARSNNYQIIVVHLVNRICFTCSSRRHLLVCFYFILFIKFRFVFVTIIRVSNVEEFKQHPGRFSNIDRYTCTYTAYRCFFLLLLATSILVYIYIHGDWTKIFAGISLNCVFIIE